MRGREEEHAANLIKGRGKLGAALWKRSTQGVLFFLAITTAVSQSKDQYPILSGFEHTSWTQRNGAPDDVQVIAQTMDGYLWLGAISGLYRFDGVRFTRYRLPGGVELPSSNVSTLYAPKTGGLWIGYRFGGATFLHNGKGTSYGAAEGLEAKSVLHFVEDTQGRVWAATLAGLMLLQGGRWQKVGADWNYPYNVAQEVGVDKAGTLWVLSSQDISYLKPGSHSFHSVAMQVSGAGFVPEQDETVFLSQTKLLKSPAGGDALQPYRKENLVKPGGVAILHDCWGGLWVEADGYGLYRVQQGETWQEAGRVGRGKITEVFSTNQGLSSNNIYKGIQDREGNIWIGTERGLDRFTPRKFFPSGFPLSLSQTSIAVGEKGDIFASTANVSALHISEEGSAKQLAGLSKYLTSVYRDPHGELWFSGEEGLWHGRPGHFQLTPLPKVEKRPIDLVGPMTMDRAGDLWASIIRSGVYRFSKGKWIQFAGMDGFPFEAASVELTDRNGRIWFGFRQNGLIALEENKLTRYSSHDIGVGALMALTEKGDRLWIGGTDGLSSLEKGQLHFFHTEQAEALKGISGIVATANGDLWLNAVNGVTYLSAEELRKAQQWPGYKMRAELFDGFDGLPGGSDQSYHSQSAVQDLAGKIWFATRAGVAWIDPAHRWKNTMPPPVMIEALEVDGRVYESPRSVVLNPKPSNVKIVYTATSLSVPERVMFRYRLEGVDTEWQDPGQRREAFYTNLAPGTYRFRVIACNGDGVWNESGAELSFQVLPTFRQTHWFTLLCALAGAGIIWLLYHLRVRQLAERQRERLTVRLLEREQIARELHDTLLQGFQGLILRFQAAMQFIAEADPARKKMEDALDRADILMAEGRDKIKDLRSPMDGFDDLQQHFSDLAEEMSQTHPAKFRFSTVPEIQPLHPLVCEEVYWIVREAVANAFHHAEATEIEVEISYGSKELRIRIRDNGRGIDPSVLREGKKAGHWGVPGMYERADQICGRLEIKSRSGEGTEIRLSIPGKLAYGKADKENPRRF